ncbi:hypothetical protein OAG68_02885 [bacterium]|nr:hypothetical protein [bacterium]
MNLEIHNYLSGSYLLETQSNSWDTIVILDSNLPESSFVKSKSQRSLQLKFDDITNPTAKKIAPTAELVQRAIEFGLQSKNLLVCCRAGQSRSAAIAFSIGYEKIGKSFALELLNPQRHSPNGFIIEIAATLIGRPGLLDTFDQWIGNRGKIRMTDHLDEIEEEYRQLETLGAKNHIAGFAR